MSDLLEMGEWDRWEPYFDHVEKVTIPNNRRLIGAVGKMVLKLRLAELQPLNQMVQIDVVCKVQLVGITY